jgi:hypothetical protein
MTPVVLALPFTGRWLVQNSPARRVPSHGTDLLGERYAIDFVAVDDRSRTAPVRDWRTWLSTEPPSRFYAFGRPVLAPADGVVVAVHDAEPDHAARRSQLALLPYAFTQASRLRAGVAAVAGNHVILALDDGSTYVALVHLRAGSVRPVVGVRVRAGDQLAECGSSGNSTQPHLHLQAMDSLDLSVACGVPVQFRGFREWRRAGTVQEIESGIPGERAVVEPWRTTP